MFDHICHQSQSQHYIARKKSKKVLKQIICYNLRLKSKIKKESYIIVNIRELNRVPGTKYLPYIY